MKASGFLCIAQGIIPVEWRRLQQQAVGLRKLGLYPDGREGGLKGHVTLTQAAHLIRVMALNLNPAAADFEEKVNEYKDLVSPEGVSFFEDFEKLISDDPSHLWGAKQLTGDESGGLIQQVNRVSFSMDRPFVTIVSRRFNAGYDPEEGFYKSKAYAEVETVYGKEVSGILFERFAIVKSSALKEFQSLEYIDLISKIETQ